MPGGILSDDDAPARFGVVLGHVDVIAQLLAADEPLEKSLSRIVELALDFVPGCDTSGISLADHERLHTRAATGPVAELMDEYQYLTDEGPCLVAIRDGVLVRVPDIASELRWPVFAPMARQAGVSSILSIPFPHTDGRVHGALNLYSSTQPFQVADERTAGLAALAGLAVNYGDTSLQMERLVSNLRQAVRSREVIGRAKGMIMERERVTSEDAFAILREASQHQGVGIRELAESLVSTGTLGPTGSIRPGEVDGSIP